MDVFLYYATNILVMISFAIYLPRFLSQRKVLKPRTQLTQDFVDFQMIGNEDLKTMLNNENSQWEKGKTIKYVDYFEGCFLIIHEQESRYAG